MANSKINFTLTSAADIKKLDELFNGLKAQGSAINDEKQGAKIEQYQHVIADIAASGVKLVTRGEQKNRLPKEFMSDLKDALTEAGVTAASVKRLAENTNRLLSVMPELLDVKGFSGAAMALDRAGIVTESKLVAKFKAPVDPLDVLAQKLHGLDQADRNIVLEKLAALDKAAEEAAKALEEGEKNGDDLTAAQNAFADVA